MNLAALSISFVMFALIIPYKCRVVGGVHEERIGIIENEVRTQVVEYKQGDAVLEGYLAYDVS